MGAVSKRTPTVAAPSHNFAPRKPNGNESIFPEFCTIPFVVPIKAQRLTNSQPRKTQGVLHHNVGPLAAAQNAKPTRHSSPNHHILTIHIHRSSLPPTAPAPAAHRSSFIVHHSSFSSPPHLLPSSPPLPKGVSTPTVPFGWSSPVRSRSTGRG